MIKLKDLLFEAQPVNDGVYDLRGTLRIMGWDKNKIKRFALLFFKDVMEFYPNIKVLDATIKTPVEDPSTYFSNPRFILSGVPDLTEAKNQITQIFQKWEKIFSKDLDVDIDFTRFIS